MFKILFRSLFQLLFIYFQFFNNLNYAMNSEKSKYSPSNFFIQGKSLAELNQMDDNTFADLMKQEIRSTEAGKEYISLVNKSATNRLKFLKATKEFRKALYKSETNALAQSIGLQGTLDDEDLSHADPNFGLAAFHELFLEPLKQGVDLSIISLKK